MSSKEASDLDFSAKKGRPRKAGSVWESKMMAKTGSQFSAAADITKQNAAKIRSRSSSMGSAETQVDKKVDKQSPTTAKNKRSDLRSPQIKRTRSAATSTVVHEINSVKLRKIKSDSANVAQHYSTNEVAVDQQIIESDDETVLNEDLAIVKFTANNADQILPPPDLEQEEDEEEEKEKEIEVEVEKASLDIGDRVISLQEQTPEKLVVEEEKKLLLHNNDRSPPVTAPPIAKEKAPAIIQPKPKANPVSDHHYEASSRLQSFADLIMWRDASRSAFVFGIGAFAIISSSYTKDLNISCISVLSYLGLVYLAVSFIFRSLIRRGNVDADSRDEEYVVGEEEAVWLIKLVLPYVNEFLSKMRSLFSGDPATTMKLAVLLFILARCGGSITIWKMTKLGFFGVFMVPKLCSSYSSQLAAYGTFWIQRFGDAWESCSHKKAVAFGIFSLVWNLCSVVARIWAVFLLFVAFRYYQQCRIKEEGLREDVFTRNSDSPYSRKRAQAQKPNTTYIKTPKRVC